jgi:hypothetical protein
MGALKAIWKDGRVCLEGEADWPEGSRLIVQPVESAKDEDEVCELRFMTEEEQGDDPESIQRWIDELNALPTPPPLDPVREAEWEAWMKRMADYNIEAVRRDFEKK